MQRLIIRELINNRRRLAGFVAAGAAWLMCAGIGAIGHAAESPLTSIALTTPGRQVSYQPSGVAVNPAKRRIYITSRGEDKLLIMDERNEITARLPAPGGPSGVAVNHRQNTVYVTSHMQNALLVFDGESNVMGRQIPVGKAPTAVAVNPGTGRVYVLNSGENTLSVLDGQRVQATLKVEESAQDVAVNPALNRIYVTCYGSGTVKVFDGETNAILSTLPTGQGASGVAVNSATHRVYVANSESNTLTVVDGATNTVIGTLAVGEFPQCVAVNPNSNQVYVGSAASRTLTILDGAKGKILSILDVGLSPTALTVNPNSHRVYLASAVSNNILCLKALPDRLPQGPTVWQGQETPLSNPLTGVPSIVSDEKRAPIDAALTSILGLTARKKFEEAHKILAGMETQYGASLELALYQATVLTQQGEAEKARILLQKWIPPSLTAQNSAPTSVLTINVPSNSVPSGGTAGTSSLVPGQPTLPNGFPLPVPQAADAESKIERLPIVGISVEGGSVAAISGPEFYVALEKAMVDLINELRRTSGLPLVAWDAQLADCARAHSVEMRDKKYFGSYSPTPQLRTVSDRYTQVFRKWDCTMSENVLRANTGGKPLSASIMASAYQSFAKSPTHRSIMLDPRWTRGGIGFATDEKGGLWITQMFATTPRKAGDGLK